MNTPTPDPQDPSPPDLRLDALLDGELSAAERQAELQALQTDPALRKRYEARRTFLEQLRAAGAREREGRTLPPRLLGRVRLALQRKPARWAGDRRAAWRIAVAASLLVGVGLGVLMWGSRTRAQALPAEIRAAAALLQRSVPLPDHGQGQGSGCADRATSPEHFPPVREQVLRVGRCLDDRPTAIDSRAVLFRPEDTVRLGYVAVPAEGSGAGPEIGMTALGDTVVFDLAYGRTRYYLAAPRAFVEAQGTCAACHGAVARAAPNPHKIVQRAWQR